MTFRTAAALALAVPVFAVPALAQPLRVVSDKAVSGFTHAESVAYDPAGRVFYVSDFGSHKLDPTLKDGKGRIMKLALDGKVADASFLPAPGETPLNKPKGIWVHGNRLWVTDIDAVWVFDLRTRKGRRLALPQAKFANDAAVAGNALYVSDNAADKLYRIEPADFLNTRGEPAVAAVLDGAKVHPNGLYPAADGTLLLGGFTPNRQNPLYAYSRGRAKALSGPLGRIDGLYRMADGTVLGTDWDTGSLFLWTKKSGMAKLAAGFKGPADFCVVPQKSGYLVAVPDLVQGSIRLIQLAR